MPAPPIMDLGSGINTQDTIRKLIEVERRPLRRMERDNGGYQAEIQAWEKLRSHTKYLSETSRELYSATSPFHKRLLVSSDPQAVSGTALNGAKALSKKVHVEQIASHHEIHSKPILPDTALPPAQFSVRVGKEKRNLNFSGGNPEQLKDFLAEKLKDLLDVSEISADGKKQVLRLYSRKSGRDGRLDFDDPQGLLIKAGLVEKRRQQASINFNPDDLSSKSRDAKFRYKIRGDGKRVQWNNGTVLLELKEPYLAHKGAHLRLRLNAKKAPPQSTTSLGPHKTEEAKIGPDISVQVGDVHLSGKHIGRTRNVPLEGGIDLGPPRVRTRVTLVYEHQGKRKSRTFSRSLAEGSAKKWNLSLDKIPKGARIQTLRFYTNGESEIQEPYFETAEKLQPANESQAPKDAVLKVDGVRLHRSQNTALKDILPGASLNLKSPTKGPVELKIKADEDAVIKKIKEWVKAYNTMHGYLRKNMRTSTSTEIAPPTVGERQRSRDQGGFFATDSTARQLKAQSYEVIALAYPAKPKGFRVLAEIGITTGAPGSRWEDISGGILKLEEEKLNDAIAKNPGGVQRIFGSDNNKDLRLDNGAGYKMEKILKPYSQSSRGLISVRVDLLKNKISSNKDRIYRRELMLERKRENLRRQFGRMEQAIKRNRSMGEYLKRTNTRSSEDKN